VYQNNVESCNISVKWSACLLHRWEVQGLINGPEAQIFVGLQCINVENVNRGERERERERKGDVDMIVLLCTKQAIFTRQ